MKGDKRQTRELAGRRAEARAMLFLRIRGYKILDTRVKTPLGEIDIIAYKKTTLLLSKSNIDAKKRP